MNPTNNPWQEWFTRPFGNPDKRAIAEAFIQNHFYIGQLLKAIEEVAPREAARMAWVVEEISAISPETLEEHKEIITALTLRSDSQPILRNMLKIMLLYPVSDDMATALFNRCLHLASDDKNDVAVRCNALSLAQHIAMQYPGLEQELFVLAQSLQHEGSAGMQTRIRKLLILISKP
jgi:hypothetical protein